VDGVCSSSNGSSSQATKQNASSGILKPQSAEIEVAQEYAKFCSVSLLFCNFNNSTMSLIMLS
jgi:hypothetical protein